jgi:N-acetylmuramoyl-L-alanine amidase
MKNWMSIALTKRNKWNKTFLALCLALCAQASPAQDPYASDAAAVVARGIPFSEGEIARIATNVANSKRFFERDYGRIVVEARYDVGSGTLVLDPGARFGPISGFVEVEYLHDAVNLAVEPIARLLPNYKYTDWVYGGQDLYHWFPAERRPADNGQGGIHTRSSGLGSSVLVSAGHGYYFHHTYKDWRPQREVSNGILEDQITPVLADALASELMSQGTLVHYSRISEPRMHEPSKQPYQMVAARYQLEELLSFMPDIWHSLPDSKDPMREYLEDIRSRPLYANFLEVDEAIHLHTNADENPAASGARVFVQKGRVADVRMGDMVLCYMKEQIHSVPKYAGYRVAESVGFADKGENRLAAMPSIIIEAGFHTNPTDADALNDSLFQRVAMRGVAKGYRLYRENRDCREFAMAAPKESSGVEGQVVAFPITFSGNPDFPVALSVIEKDCSTLNCHRAATVFYREEDYANYTHDFLCNEGSGFRDTAVLVAQAHDRNDVVTPEMIHTVRCARKGGSADLVALNREG